MQLRFTKMHGLGNDFVVTDSVTQDIVLNPEQIRFIADRKYGVGCDQLLLIEPPSSPDIDFNYRIFNADGNEVEQCGNGARCLGKYVTDKRLTGKHSIQVATCNSRLQIEILRSNQVRVDMGRPKLAPADIPITAEHRQTTYHLQHKLGNSEFGAISMGNPHAVLLVDDVASAPVETLGPLLESHPFFPNRVNVGFMQVNSPGSMALRVFERGVGETQACGTGACAAMVSARLRQLVSSRVEVTLTGGKLLVEWAGEDQPVLMTGSASKVFDGKIKL